MFWFSPYRTFISSQNFSSGSWCMSVLLRSCSGPALKGMATKERHGSNGSHSELRPAPSLLYDEWVTTLQCHTEHHAARRYRASQRPASSRTAPSSPPFSSPHTQQLPCTAHLPAAASGWQR